MEEDMGKYLKLLSRHFLRFILLIYVISSIVHTTPLVWGAVSVEQINKSIVKIFSVNRAPDYSQPWDYQYQQNISGSGVIIGGNRILTNAHVVSDSIYLEIKKANDPTKYTAKVKIIGHQCDLAILEVEDPSFFNNTKPLEVGDLPDLQDEVSVYGFPEGGEQVSISKGIVSRIEQMEYTHGNFDLLGVQIDAAINSGNSGGAVLKDDKIIGIAMQTLESADNIGYIIPAPIIKHFLKDIEDGSFDTFPDNGILIENMESESLRNYYGMETNQTGILVVSVLYGSSSYGIVKEDDVIISIDGLPVANDGSVKLNENIRVGSDYLVQKHYIGEKLKMRVIRDKKKVDLSFPLKKAVELVTVEYDVMPTYFIYGGLIFTPLTYNFLFAWGDDWFTEAPVHLLNITHFDIPKKDKRQVIILNQVIPHEINIGFHDWQYMVLDKVNGKKIRDIKDLVSVIRGNEDRFTLFEMADEEKIVIDNKFVKEAEKEMYEDYGIPSGMSKNLQ